ncbi:MAG: JAB domain-containing protein [Aquificae bacterium]|nr:JAB domain-containing protein [Aquificota bacterium]
MEFQKKLYRKKIRELPEELLPREKALKYGIQSLSDIELLALLLGKGTKNMNVLGLADRILGGKGIQNLKKLNMEELTNIEGIGKAKALQLIAVKEIARRLEEQDENLQLNSPQEVYSHVRWLSKEKQEKMLVLYTNTMNQLLGEEVVAVGSVNLMGVKPRDIFVHALKYNAYGIILVHNHPEGSFEPSKEDIRFTKKIKETAELLGFELLDHIIVGRKGFSSLYSSGLI